MLTEEHPTAQTGETLLLTVDMRFSLREQFLILPELVIPKDLLESWVQDQSQMYI